MRAVMFIMLGMEFLPGFVRAQETGAAFFEAKIRPVLVAECYDCHHEGKTKGGLALDSRLGWEKGGESGAVIVRGAPEASLLIRSIRHADADLKMPAKAPKLSDAVIADFVSWIRMGAPDPRDKAQPKVAEKAREWPEVRQERSQWWCFQPLMKSATAGRPLHEVIDLMIQKKLTEAKLSPAPRAAKPVLIRRLHYALTGLPPTAEEVWTFVNNDSLTSYAQRMDQWMCSTQFGEQWARHWMDVVHYSETHGSESDALIPFAWRYRDYLIRAFNADVPYDQLAREHVAGDLLQGPRLNAKLGINESIIGTAFWRFVEFYHTPVDVKREEVAVIDGQIDTFGKAFQALTISCARCHDHKFDPIGNTDFYALYGMLASTRTAMRVIDNPEPFVRHNGELTKLKERLRPVLAEQWLEEVKTWPAQIQAARAWLLSHPVPPLPAKPDPAKEKEFEAGLPKDAWTRALFHAARQKDHGLTPLSELATAVDAAIPTLWKKIGEAQKKAQQMDSTAVAFADFTDGKLEGWKLAGAGLPQEAKSRAGEIAMASSGETAVRSILERGYHSDVLSDRHAGSLRSPDFIIKQEVISVLARGESKARLRLVIENFQGDSVLFSGVNPDVETSSLHWFRLGMKPQWIGRRAYLELLTRDDKPNVNNIKETESLSNRDGRSAFGIARVVFHPARVRMQDAPALPLKIWQKTPRAYEEVIEELREAVEAAIGRWKAQACDDADARLLTALIGNGLLDGPMGRTSALSELMAEYRRVESTIPIAQRVPGVIDDGSGHDCAFFPRGDHAKPEGLVPRQYLEVLKSNKTQYAGTESGRLQLAQEITDKRNPLTARVMVNRVWHWLFGQGLVSTVDNFGRMGAEPTHPELLDHLAREFMAHGWSVKYLIREILLSETWQRNSVAPAKADEVDPGNRLWSHANIRRLEAESVRDTLLAVAGNLSAESYGPSVRTYYKVAVDADKQPPAGPLDGGGRRSLYLEVRRNFPSAFLAAFDFPKPVATAGKRSETNVPAQSLALMNDPFVKQQAQVWAKRIMSLAPDAKARIRRMYEEAFGRQPDAGEEARALGLIRLTINDEINTWANLAHAMMNMKEMIYLP